jgi:hypothetical protein
VAVLTIFNAALGAAFAPSRPFLLNGDKLVFDFDIVVAAGPDAVIEFFEEFASDNPLDPNTRWYRQTAEEDIGGGVVHMPIVVRDFQKNGTGPLPPGTHRLSVPLVRTHHFCRLQIRITAGFATANIVVPFGVQAIAPA